VKVHDFADKALGKVALYGVYDIGANTGWVNVGTDADTGQFAVESIRRWWTTMGAISYPGSDKLLITADSGALAGPGCGCGKQNSPRSPPKPDSTSRSATCRPAPPNGTRSNTGCSPRSAATGADDPWNPMRL
jgi:hypothetical protein